MNTELLKQMYCIYSPSGNTKKMRRFLKREITKRGGKFTQDSIGNIFVTKGKSETYPCLASHVDQVSNHTHSKDFRCIESNDIIMGFSDKMREQQGLGADDKNGIFVCLNALERFDIIKVAFFVDEEIGCHGSSKADLSFFDDCRFVIEPDRRGGSDFISSMSGSPVCSDEFSKATGFKNFGYKHEEGTVTDVLTLLENGLGISCLNLSCGYYHAHTDQEVTVVSELENCQNLVFHIIETCTDVYPFNFENAWRANYGDYLWDDSDYDTMEFILSEDANLAFEDVINKYFDNFMSRDMDMLRSIYEDVKAYINYHPEMEIDDDDLKAQYPEYYDKLS